MSETKTKIIFMGTPKFAADILKELSLDKGCEICAVYTMPDAVRGRGKKLVPSPVKLAAIELDIPVFTPQNFKEHKDINQLKTFNADFICVAAYGVIIPDSVLQAPKYCCLNVHGSLLPKWRGAAPIQRAILAGDKKIGFSIMRMDTGMDTGDYCIQKSIDSKDKTLNDVYCWMAKEGTKALFEAMTMCVNNTVEWIKQDSALVSVAQKIQKRELWFSKEDSIDLTYRKILASSAEAPFKCNIAGKNVTIVQAKMTDGKIDVLKIKPDGKNEMDWKSFLAGINNSKDISLDWGVCEY